jgi:DNA recombination protein RmuC
MREQIEADLKTEIQAEREGVKTLQKQWTELKSREAQLVTTIREERKQAQEKLAILNRAQEELSNAFKALSADALKSNNKSFLELAQATLEKFQETAKGDLEKRQFAIDELVKPVKESLGKVDEKLQTIEKARVEAYAGLTEQVKALSTTQQELRSETANLVKSLRKPDVRGRWGEIQLRNVVELAGMLNHCDFVEQQSVETEDGSIRPDLIVRLPGAKNIVVDSKAPLAAFLDAVEAPDEKTRIEKLKDHARQVKSHVQSLGKKSYFAQFDH